MKRVFALVLVLAVTGAVAAETAGDDFSSREGSILSAKVGVNLLQAGSNSTTENRIGFTGGLGATYFFTGQVGAFLDVAFMPRGYKAGSLSSTATFIDIPFGFAFNHGKGFFSASSRSHTRLGGYLALPLGEFPAGALLTAQPSSTFFGLRVDNETHFPINEHFSLGYTIWINFALGSALKNVDSKFYEIGLGLVVGFF